MEVANQSGARRSCDIIVIHIICSRPFVGNKSMRFRNTKTLLGRTHNVREYLYHIAVDMPCIIDFIHCNMLSRTQGIAYQHEYPQVEASFIVQDSVHLKFPRLAQINHGVCASARLL